MKNEWKKVTLGDVVKITSGNTPSKENANFWNGEFPWISAKDMKTKYLSDSILKLSKTGFDVANKAPVNSLVVLTRGMTLHTDVPICLVKKQLAFNQDVKCLIPNTTINSEYLYYYLQNNKRDLLNLVDSAGNGTGRLDSEILKDMEICFPSPEEQINISDTLSTWDSAIEKTEKLISEKEKLYKGYLKYFYIETGNCIKLSEFAEETSRRNKSKELTQVLSVTNKNGFVPPEQQFGKKIASEDLSNYKIIMKGQFAYNPSRINVGSIARLDEYISAVLSPMYTVFEINNKIINSNYFLHWLSSKYAIHQIKLCAQGGVREIVSFEDFKKMKIKSLPLEKQEKIADFLNLQKSEISLLKKQLEQYKLQKQGLMQKLLTGEWRVR